MPTAQPLRRQDSESMSISARVAPADPLAHAGHRIDPERRRGRGATINPGGRYEAEQRVAEDDGWGSLGELPPFRTEIAYEKTRSIITRNDSPDISFDRSINPYRGCEHGCVYCFARPSHAYLGLSPGLDFESKIVVKHNAPQLLRKFFENRNWQPAPVSLSGNTDCYQPIERKMKLTRQLLEICLEFRNPVGLITKNALILRDLDILKELAALNLVCVYTSVTSTDEKLRSLLEPRTATYKSRLQVVSTLSAAGIPTGIMNAPLIPGLNDTHIHDTLQAAAEAGARWAGYTIVRLNGAIGDIFKDWLYKAFPDRAEKVWHLIQGCHGGQVNDSRFATRMTGEGQFATIIRQQFKLYCRKFGLNETTFSYNLDAFRRIKNGQLPLF